MGSGGREDDALQPGQSCTAGGCGCNNSTGVLGNKSDCQRCGEGRVPAQPIKMQIRKLSCDRAVGFEGRL